MPFRFEGLEIWQMARRFSNSIYEVTARFPEGERYSLTSQMTRAANSICLNIAEGAGRDTKTDFNRFLSIAIGSAFEVASALCLALDRGYFTNDVYNTLYDQADHLSRSIQRFRATLHSK